jgi:hypothetical protein
MATVKEDMLDSVVFIDDGSASMETVGSSRFTLTLTLLC